MLKTFFLSATALLSVAFASAAPRPVPASFQGEYMASGYSSKSTDSTNTNRGYSGTVRILSSGEVTGRITRTDYVSTAGNTEQHTKRVRVGGKITRVRATTHGGYKVLVATTRVTLSDGQSGILTLYYPYTVNRAGKSGQGTIEGQGFSGNMHFQEKS